jgi:hypothetical protein
MPIPVDLCDPAAVLCCEALIDDGDLILAAAQAALFECYGFDPDDDECSAPFDTFMSWGPPATAYQDYLTAWVESIFRVTPLQVSSPKVIVPTGYRVTWVVRSSASGFPTFTKEGNVPMNPDLAAIDLMSRVMLALGTKMVSALSGFRIHGCTPASIESMTPAVGGGEVLGGSAGVTLRMSYTRNI